MNAGAGVGHKGHRKRTDLATFLSNARISWLSRGTFGIVLKAENTSFTPYVDIWTGNPVHAILLKLSPITPPNSETVDVRVEWDGVSDTDPVETSRKSDFENETTLQLQLFAQSKRRPLCPALLDSTFMPTKSLAQLIPQLRLDRPLTIGIIAMELVANATPMDQLFLEDPSSFSDYAALARAKLLQLGMLGYSHGDFHGSNVLIADGDAVLIDFAATKRLPPAIVERIKASVASKDYVQALRLIMLRPLDNAEDVNFPAELFTNVTYSDKERLQELRDNEWANTAETNAVLADIVNRYSDGIFQNYRTLYGWIFDNEVKASMEYPGKQLLTLTPQQKRGITKALARKSAASSPLIRVRESPLRRTRHRESGSESYSSQSSVSHRRVGKKTRGLLKNI